MEKIGLMLLPVASTMTEQLDPLPHTHPRWPCPSVSLFHLHTQPHINPGSCPNPNTCPSGLATLVVTHLASCFSPAHPSEPGSWAQAFTMEMMCRRPLQSPSPVTPKVPSPSPPGSWVKPSPSAASWLLSPCQHSPWITCLSYSPQEDMVGEPGQLPQRVSLNTHAWVHFK